MESNPGMVSPIKVYLREVTKRTYYWKDGITIFYIIDGEIGFNTWAGKSKVKKNDLIILERRVVFNIETISKSNKIIIITIDEEFYKNLFPDNNRTFIYCNSTKIKRENKYVYGIIRNHLKDLLFNLIIHNFNTNIQEIKDSVIELLKFIVEKFDFTVCGVKEKENDSCFTSIYKNLYEDINYPVDELREYTLKEAARNYNISYERLKKGFSYRYGHGYMWFKTALIRDKAARMLLSTNDSIAQISYSCSFSDPKYLINSFKSFYGCTPSQFRLRYKENGTQYEDIYRDLDLKLCLNAEKLKTGVVQTNI